MSILIDKIIWRLFPYFERVGIHVLPIHFYSPIPDTRLLRQKGVFFNIESAMHAINLPKDEQMQFIADVVAPYQSEYVQILGAETALDADKFPTFAPLNALTLFAIIRYFQPRRVIEVGSGASTRIALLALASNNQEGVKGELICIDPFISPELRYEIGDRGIILQQKVELVPESTFLELGENDILFIDSTHTVKIFGDVNFLFLTILPQLKPGVIIQIHDIFFPQDYPAKNVIEGKNFWQEQYLLHAFLMFNHEFEVILCCSYCHSKYKDQLQNYFPWYHVNRCPSSFWMRRIKNS